MTVHFIGAGPGDPELLTLKAYKIISSSPICIYAGSLIPKKLLSHCPKNADLIDSSKMDLESIRKEFLVAKKKKKNIARLHSGDLSMWSTLSEQIRILKNENIRFTITPGITSFSLASALLESQFTLPGISQTIILTRTQGRASPMPSNEKLENLAKIGATLVIHLSIKKLNNIIEKLLPYYGKKCPIAILYRMSWPEEKIIRGNLSNIIEKTPKTFKRSALIIVSKTLFNQKFINSSLYSSSYETRFRKVNNLNKDISYD